MLLFLPLFAARADETVYSVSLFALSGNRIYMKICYYAIVTVTAFVGILTIAMQNCQTAFWIKNKTKISFLLSIVAVTLFILSLQPYAAIFSLALLIIKAIFAIKL